MAPLKIPRSKTRTRRRSTSTDLHALLGLDIQPSPERHWEGDLKGDRGAADNRTVFVRARIGFHGGLVAGEGSAPEFPTRRPPGAFSLTGTASASALQFALWFADEIVGRSPFACEGTLDAEERDMRGAWSFDCFYPDTCGCGGGGGTFHLWRVD